MVQLPATSNPSVTPPRKRSTDSKGWHLNLLIPSQKESESFSKQISNSGGEDSTHNVDTTPDPRRRSADVVTLPPYSLPNSSTNSVNSDGSSSSQDTVRAGSAASNGSTRPPSYLSAAPSYTSLPRSSLTSYPSQILDRVRSRAERPIKFPENPGSLPARTTRSGRLERRLGRAYNWTLDRSPGHPESQAGSSNGSQSYPTSVPNGGDPGISPPRLVSTSNAGLTEFLNEEAGWTSRQTTGAAIGAPPYWFHKPPETDAARYLRERVSKGFDPKGYLKQRRDKESKADLPSQDSAPFAKVRTKASEERRADRVSTLRRLSGRKGSGVVAQPTPTGSTDKVIGEGQPQEPDSSSVGVDGPDPTSGEKSTRARASQMFSQSKDMELNPTEGTKPRGDDYETLQVSASTQTEFSSNHGTVTLTRNGRTVSVRESRPDFGKLPEAVRPSGYWFDGEGDAG